jgi:hypothetical protein
MKEDSSKAETASATSGRRQRRYPRHPLDVRMTVTVSRPTGVSHLWGRSSELGQDGIGGTLTGDLEPGEVVSMEMQLPLSAKPMKLRAIVRYRQGLHYGFEFLTVTDDQRSAIQRVCHMLSATSSSDSA